MLRQYRYCSRCCCIAGGAGGRAGEEGVWAWVLRVPMHPRARASRGCSKEAVRLGLGTWHGGGVVKRLRSMPPLLRAHPSSSFSSFFSSSFSSSSFSSSSFSSSSFSSSSSSSSSCPTPGVHGLLHTPAPRPRELARVLQLPRVLALWVCVCVCLCVCVCVCMCVCV